MSAPTTLVELTSGISFADVGLGILAVAALVAAIAVMYRGAKLVLSAVRLDAEKSRAAAFYGCAKKDLSACDLYYFSNDYDATNRHA